MSRKYLDFVWDGERQGLRGPLFSWMNFLGVLAVYMGMRQLIVVLVAAVMGCGPMTVPAVRRVTAEEQKMVDQAWENMLSPRERLGRRTLLDCLILMRMHEHGIDRLRLESEKELAAGRVVMEVYFDRKDEAADRMVVSVYDPAWELV